MGTDKTIKYWPVWKRLIFFIMAFVIFLSFVYIMTPNQPTEKPNWKYYVCVSNWVGTSCTPCVSYKRMDNTYILYDENLDILGEITLTDGYVGKVRKYK